jgi:hypothetical protein
MRDLASQRCLNHALREAAARCPQCGHCFCRECITEHEDQVICAACLRKLAAGPSTARRRRAGFFRLGQALAGLLAAWFFFYLVGEALMAVPASVHEGTLWRVSWWNSE